jgi:CO/xanthine dehydrogenase Mo-binding subunit
MEFLMPYATEIPAIEIDHIETPSPPNPLGIKGAGEAGVPLSPLKLYELSERTVD